MSLASIKNNFLNRIKIKPTPRVVRAVDLIGQWAAPITIVIVLVAAIFIAPAFYSPINLKTVAIQHLFLPRSPLSASL